MIQWMSQTSRVQAFLMLSCLVILVESFVCPSAMDGTSMMQRYRPQPICNAVAFNSVPSHLSSSEEDLSWNNTASAMDAARLTASSPSVVLVDAVADADQAVVTDATSSRPDKFEPTVSHTTLDHWFHVLSGMEEERIVGEGNEKRKFWRKQHPPSTKTAKAPTDTPAPAPSQQQGGGSNKPTDHWML